MHVEITFTDQPIVIPPLALPSREVGACVEFQGIVRELEQGGPLTGLHYEAYPPMARNLLARHCTDIATRHPCAACVLIHRLGWVPIGEASLYVRVLSTHRGEGLRFLAELIDQLKTDVPIWKRA